MPEEDNPTTIRISKKTRERLGLLGTVNDDMDAVISKLLDEREARLKSVKAKK